MGVSGNIPNLKKPSNSEMTKARPLDLNLNSNALPPGPPSKSFYGQSGVSDAAGTIMLKAHGHDNKTVAHWPELRAKPLGIFVQFSFGTTLQTSLQVPQSRSG